MAKKRIVIKYQTRKIEGSIVANGSCSECPWNLHTSLRAFKESARVHAINNHDGLPIWRGSRR